MFKRNEGATQAEADRLPAADVFTDAVDHLTENLCLL
jgi:hypothetical protein